MVIRDVIRHAIEEAHHDKPFLCIQYTDEVMLWKVKNL